MKKTEWTMETLDNLSAFKRDIASNTTIKHKNTITEEVLDKIRAEIEQNAYPIVHGVNSHEKGMTLYGILQVFDKYKTESEE